MSAISIRKLTKRYPGTQAGLFDFSLEVESAEHIVIAGPSGAGKTTLLRLIAGLETVDAGHLAIAGRAVTNTAPQQRGVALVAQRPAVYPHLSVRRNLAISVELRQKQSFWQHLTGSRNGVYVSREELNFRIAEAAETLGLTPLLDRHGDRLSGGEQQRVALGRAWVARAGAWLLDEPFAHLEPTLRAAIRAELHLLRGRSGATMLEVTHDPGDALALGRRVAVLRAGRLEQVGPAAELYARPASRTVAAALGSPAINFADGVVLGVDGHPAMQLGHGVTVPLPPAAGARAGSGEPVSLGVRPEHIIPAPGSAGLVALGDWTVVRAVPWGPAWLATLEQSGLVWTAWIAAQPKRGSMPLAADVEHVLLFDEAGARIWPVDRKS
jgi:multiple sugar transport system ATP-binding protein